MHVQSALWRPGSGLQSEGPVDPQAGLALYFGPRALLEDGAFVAAMRAACPQAILFGCSSGGQIIDGDVRDDAVAVQFMRFERTRVAAAASLVAGPHASRAAGADIAARLDARDLAGVLALTDGLLVNGSEFVRGMRGAFGRDVAVCGGMAGDGSDFQRTLVGLGGAPQPGMAAAIGFYGDSVAIGHGSAGGWDVFGPSRTITASRGSVLEELDGKPALDLYTRYLAPEDIAGLPGTGLLFPLLVRNPDRPEQELVRTILGIDRETGAMTFAGDMPKGWSAQLMRGTIDSLTRGAETAASQIGDAAPATAGGLAVMVSCIGRRLVMGQHIVNEIDAVAAQLPPGFATTGFYSYGEFSPHARTGACELHNQTMTVMTLTERAA